MPSSETWFHLDSGPCAPAWNMAFDEALLETAAHTGAALLRFYGWTEPAATFGYSQRIAEVERATLLRPLIRRCTGGGFVPHDHDWTYSLAFPPCHRWFALSAQESYEAVHAWLSDAFALLGVETTLSPCCVKEAPGQCFVGAEKHDLLWHGRKIAGAAQRRTKLGLLIQGSVQPPAIGLSRGEWQAAMLGTGSAKHAASWRRHEAGGEFEALVRRLTDERYSADSHNRKR